MFKLEKKKKKTERTRDEAKAGGELDPRTMRRTYEEVCEDLKRGKSSFSQLQYARSLFVTKIVKKGSEKVPNYIKKRLS